MKIAILGTKGIPNNYGGFEQFAEYLSIGLTNLGHSVIVYNPSYHPYKESIYQGVVIQKIFSPENLIGGAANFIYDHLCLKHALNQKFDIIYEAGYHSVALSYWLLSVKKKRSPILITNMDGLEWKRTKWSFFVKGLIKKLEKVAVKQSHYLVSDNLGIQEYYKQIFQKDSFYIPYGADIPSVFSKNLLMKYGLQEHGYFIVVARLEPENNVDLIINGFCNSTSQKKLVVVGNVNRYGNFLQKRFKDDRVVLVGGVYNKNELDSLRFFSLGYFHGHSVGGTNPSLLEAMASSCFIMAHDNVFNRSILNDSAFYFRTVEDVTSWVNSIETVRENVARKHIAANVEKIRNFFSWKGIASDYEALFMNLLRKQGNHII